MNNAHMRIESKVGKSVKTKYADIVISFSFQCCFSTTYVFKI